MMESMEIVIVDRWTKTGYKGLKIAMMKRKYFKFHCKENATNFETTS